MIEVVVRSKHGLHARPASSIVSTASKYTGEVYFLKDGNRYNAKSIMSVMSMRLIRGEALIIEAIGEGSSEIENILKELIEAFKD